MSVSLTPANSLGFNRPLTQIVKRTLSIYNPNAQPVAFKVKTTAPKLYCVRPNSGRIEPGDVAEVAVMLQAMKEEPALSAKCRDKFLIQSTLITQDMQTLPVHDIWSTTSEDSEEHRVFQQKLKVVYLPPDGQIPEEDEEGQGNLSSMWEPHESRYDTVRQTSSANGYPTDTPPEFTTQPQLQLPTYSADTDPGRTAPQPPLEEEPRSHTPPAEFNVAHEDIMHEPDTFVPSDVGPRPDTPPTPPRVPQQEPLLHNDVILAKYEAALEEIDRLRGLLAATARPPSTELRRRNRPLSDDGSMMGETDVGTSTMIDDNPVQDGVPLQVVVIIALGVFITTYLFF